jgi:beta-ureidopropionase
VTGRLVRAALTQTRNAYLEMPDSTADLHHLADRLDDIRQANVDKHVTLLREARAQGAQVVCFGELFTAPYFALGDCDPMWRALAEDALEGATVRQLRREAAALGVIVVAPIYERDATLERCFNTAVVIDEAGQVLGRYRKTHIPQGGNEQGSFDELYYYGPGHDQRGADEPSDVSNNTFFPVFQTSLGRLGVAICYDRHFPGVMSSLAQEGAELVFCPAVTFGAKSQRMWHMEFPVDACRHRIFVGGSNRVGREPPWTQEYFGESYFVGPDGVLPNLSTDPELVISDVDLASLQGPDPSGWDLPRDVRPEIYSPGCGPRKRAPG